MSDSHHSLRRSVNGKALLTLVALVAGLATGLYFTHRAQVRRNAAGLLRQADQAEQEGHQAQAARYLREYLGLVPDDAAVPQVLARYALLMAREANSPRQKVTALGLCETVLRRKPDSSEVRREMRREAARLAVDLGWAAAARIHLKSPELPTAATDPALLLLRARCEARDRKFADAASFYAEALKRGPADVPVWEEYLWVCGKLETMKEKPEGTVEWLCGEMIKAHPNLVQAREAAARHYLQLGAVGKAEEQLDFAIRKLQSNDERVYLLSADLARQSGQIDKAGQVLQQALRANPGSARVRLKLAWVKLEAKRKAEALALVEPLRKSPPKNTEELLELGQLLAVLGELSAAREIAQGFREKRDDWARRLLTAYVHHQERQWGKARELLEGLRTEPIPSSAMAREVHLLLADCYRATGNPDQAAEAIRRAHRDLPATSATRAGLAEALAASGKTDEALAEYTRAAAYDPNWQVPRAWLLLRRELQRGSGGRNWQEVDKALAAIPAARGQDAEVVLLRCEVLDAKGQAEEARALARETLDRKPAEPSLWLFLARDARRTKGPDAALALLKEAEQRAGRRVEWDLARADLYVQTGEPGLRQLRALAAGLDHWQGKDHERLARVVGLALVTAGDQTAAVNVWRESARRHPGDVAVRLLLIDAAVQANKPDEVRRLAEEVEEAEGRGGPVAAYARAVESLLEARAGKADALKHARSHLARAAALRPNWHRVTALEGALAEYEGKKEEALGKYLIAIRRGDTTLSVLRRATQLLFERNRYLEAEWLLREAQGGADGALPSAPGVADIGLEPTGDPGAARKRALETARRVVRSGSASFSDHIWLAQVAWQAGERDEAEKALKTARQLAPDEPAPWVALVALLAQVDPSRARAELAAAERSLTTGRAQLALVAGHEILGNAKEAERRAAELAKALPHDPVVLLDLGSFHSRHGRTDEAERLWRRLLEPAIAAPPELARRARQSLAIALAMRRTYPVYLEALALVEQNLQVESTPEDLRVKAIVLATQPHSRAQAIRLLEKTTSPEGMSPPMQLLLAELYEADGRWPLARPHLQALARAGVKDPRLLAGAARALLRHGEAADAAGLVTQLAALAGETPEVAELRARWLHASGRQAEAREALLRYATDKEERALTAAQVLESLGEYEAAEGLLRKLAANPARPDAGLLLAQYLGRRRKTDEALRLCDRAWGKARDEDVAVVSVVVLREGASPAQMEQVAGKVRAALERNPANLGLILVLALVEDMSGRQDQAILLYRRVLSLDPGNVMALNNLASLLALKKKDLKQAMDMINQLIRTQGPLSDLLDTRGQVHLAAGRLDEAVQDFRDAIAQKPEPIKWFHLAQALRASEELVRARDAWQRARQLGLKEEALTAPERATYRRLAAELAGR